MAGDPVEAAASLPPWLQIGANAALFALTTIGGLWALRRGKREEARAPEEIGADEILESAGVKGFLSNVATIAESAKASADAQRTLSAATVQLARIAEDEARERRVHREAEILAAQQVARIRRRKPAARAT